MVTYLSIATVVSNIPSESPSEWKKHIFKRQPIIEMIFFLLMYLKTILGMVAMVYYISRNKKMLIKLYVGLWK